MALNEYFIEPRTDLLEGRLADFDPVAFSLLKAAFARQTELREQGDTKAAIPETLVRAGGGLVLAYEIDLDGRDRIFYHRPGISHTITPDTPMFVVPDNDRETRWWDAEAVRPDAVLGKIAVGKRLCFVPYLGKDIPRDLEGMVLIATLTAEEAGNQYLPWKRLRPGRSQIFVGIGVSALEKLAVCHGQPIEADVFDPTTLAQTK